MPDAVSEGVNIHYEVEGTGPPLVLQHGFAAALGMWRRNGAVPALREHYQLILIDARGHGQSDKPHTPAAYSQRQAAADVAAVLDDLGIETAHFYGYSLGGLVGFYLGKYAPERLRSLVLGGAHPHVWFGDPVGMTEFAALVRGGMEGVWAFAEEQYGRLPEGMRTEFLANDGEALAALVLGSLADDDLDPDLPNLGLPCLLVCGERDEFITGARAAAERMPQATFVALPGVGHPEPAERFALVEPHLRTFLAQVEASGDR
jgi:pimeloyl-ACP methyl ester carboxylesterase